MASYSLEERGSLYTLEYNAYYKNAAGEVISPWHDIPLWADEAAGVVNMVCEVPRWSNAKMEINTKEPLNPIKQDQKKGKARFVHNCFPHHGYIWNYGAIPQTWEDPEHTDPRTLAKGDGDPIDICDVGRSIAKIGEVKQVKVLGVMAMIDEGETDWKVIGIDVTDPLAEKINDIDDLDKHMPGQLAATNEWFRIYKIPAGKPENTFAFNGEAKNKAFAVTIINECADQWKKLVGAEGEHKMSRKCTTGDSAHKIDQAAAAAIIDAAAPPAEPSEMPNEVHDWHYIRLD